MLSASTIVLEYVCPAMGVITASLMFTAPWRDILKATRGDGRLGDLNPTPWAIMLGNTYGWVVYSSLIHNYFVFFANAPWFILSLWFNLQAIKLQYGEYRTTTERTSILQALQEADSTRCSMTTTTSTTKPINNTKLLPENNLTELNNKEENEEGMELGWEKQQLQQNSNDIDAELPDSTTDTSTTTMMDYAKLVWSVAAQTKQAPVAHEYLVLVIVTLWTAISTLMMLGRLTFSFETQTLIVGIAVNCNLCFFYGAPLSTIFEVFKTKSSKSIHVPTMILNTLNGVFWSSFGIGVKDYYIGVPNGLGALLGFVQMILCVMFPRCQQQQQQQNNEQQQQQSQEQPKDENSASTVALDRSEKVAG